MMKKSRFSWVSCRFFCVASLLLAGLVFLPVNQAMGIPFTIDDMNIQQGSSTTPALSLTAVGSAGPPNPNATISGPVTDIIGGWRHLFITQTANDDGGLTATYVDSSTDPNKRTYNVANDPKATGSGKIAWNGNSADSPNQLNVDLRQLNFINLGLLQNDLTATFTFDLMDGVGGITRATWSSPPGTYINFELCAVNATSCTGHVTFAPVGAGANLASIQRMEFYSTSVKDLDFQLDNVTGDILPPCISCVTKKWTTHADYSGLTDNLYLGDNQPSFPVTLYAELTVVNDVGPNCGGSARVFIQDIFPTQISKSVGTTVVSPANFNLGDSSPTSGSGTLTWTSGSGPSDAGFLLPGQTLVFRFPVTVSSFPANINVTNSFQARALTDAAFGPTTCPAIVRWGKIPVPSLNEWGAIILSLVLAAGAIWLIRRRRTS